MVLIWDDLRERVDVQKEQDRAEMGSLWYTSGYRVGCGYGGSDFDRGLLYTKVTGEPRKCVLGCKRARMVEEDWMRHFVERLSEVQEQGVVPG